MSDMSSVLARLEAVTTRLENVSGGGGAAAAAAVSLDSGAVSNSVAAFDDLLSEHLTPFVTVSKKLGGDIAEASAFLEKAFTAQRKFLTVASKCKKPADSDLPCLLKETSDQLGAAASFKDANRKSANFNHLSAVAEGAPALGWVTVAPKPGPFVGDMANSAEFYSNRVLKDHKGKNEDHVLWARSLTTMFKELQAYVKKHHTTGVVWNAKGGDAKAAMGTSAAASSGPAAPPPPAVMSAAEISAASSSSGPKKSAPDSNALFASLSKGGDVTKGLKKVDRSQMTHKNPELRASSLVKASDTKPKASAAPKFGATPTNKPPKFALEGKKWVVEYQNDNPSIVVDDCASSQTMYVYKCTKSTIKVTGKMNAITLDSCKKCAIVFENLVSTIDVVNCQSIQVQVLGSVPTVSIDKTDGCQVYLSKSSLATEVISAKSSEMNVSIPGEKEDDDYIECPLPEQFKSVLAPNGKAFVTETIKHE